MEGLASSFLFTMGGLGFIILDRSNAPNIPKLNRFLLLFIGFVCVLLSFFMARVFMRMKLPGYLMGQCLLRKSVNPGLTPVVKHQRLSHSPVRWVRRRVKSRVKATLRTPQQAYAGQDWGSRCQRHVHYSIFSDDLFDVPTMLSGIFFLVFYFLEKIYSISKTLVLNKMIIFYNPLIIFWT